MFSGAATRPAPAYLRPEQQPFLSIDTDGRRRRQDNGIDLLSEPPRPGQPAAAAMAEAAAAVER